VGRQRRRAGAGGEIDTSRRLEVSGAAAPMRARTTELFFAVTLFVSASLLFVVQPMFAKMALPLLGGAPSVWNTCLVFYQAALLAGYVYAHLSLKWLGPRRQAALHLALLCLPWVVLPIHIAQDWVPPPDVFPVFWLWLLLSVSVGLPFLIVSASAPMLQAWFAQTGSGSARDPYFLYAASNLGSLLALLGYPLLIESHLTLAEQTGWWAVAYGLLMALMVVCAVRLWRSSPTSPTAAEAAAREQGAGQVSDRPSLRRRLRWLALAFVPSSLLLGVNTHISTDLVAMPLLWVVPLALYLLTFVLVFARRSILPLPWMVRAQPYLIVVAAGALAWEALAPPTLLSLGSLQLLAFFVTAMVCHGQLAADRPASSRLTEFYLWMSLGGVLGGLFNALVAPLVFSGVLEYPLMIAVACMLRPRPVAKSPRSLAREIALPGAILLACAAATWATRSEGPLADWRYANAPATQLVLVVLAVVAAFLLRRRPLRFGLGVAVLLAMSLGCGKDRLHVLHAERSFFGVSRVTRDPVLNANVLKHGSTMHGAQILDTSERHEPLTYYHRQGPLGQIFQALQPRRPLAEIGVLGLGAGSIAAYGEPGERITFYEIDPAVERIARNPQYFTYLADCRANVEVILGDARLSLIHGAPRKFDLLVVDVFSSDSVPIHLITREALQIYLQRLADRGLLAIHISSRFLDLEPILDKLAEEAGVTARVRNDKDTNGLGKNASTWVVMARRAEDLLPIVKDPGWAPLQSGAARLWTDDFSNVVGVLKWQFSWEWLKPSTWWGMVPEAAGHYNLGNALVSQGRFNEAIGHYQKALELQPDYAEAHNNLGLALANRGRFDEAIEHYEKALELQPDFAKAHNNLGAALANRGRLDEAIGHCEKALELQPDLAEVHYNLGNALRSQGRSDEAIGHYEKALKLQPDFAEAHHNLGVALANRGRFDEAIGHYEKTLELQPDLAEAHNNLGVALAKRGRLDEAIGHYQKALEIRPDYANAHYALGNALVSQGRGDEAIGHYRKALDLATQQNKQDLVKASRAMISRYEAERTSRERRSSPDPTPTPP